jgi:hypothetical protein
MRPRQKALSLAYEQFRAELSAILYHEDPVSIGDAIGAPQDEYDAEAARLAAAIRSMRTRTEVAEQLHHMFGTTTDILSDKVYRAVRKFQIRAETDQRS